MEVPAIIAVHHGPQHIYQFASRSYLELLGHRNLLGRPMCEVVPEFVRQGLVEILDGVYATGESFTVHETQFKLDRRCKRTVEESLFNVLVQAVRDSAGTVRGVMVYAVEVTEQVLARRQAEELAAERAAILDQMADGLSTERKRAEEEQRRYSQELATRVLQAQEEERNRIARELHDETVQALSTLLVNLDLLESDLPKGTGLLPRFEQTRSIARRALKGTRDLAHALRPTALDDMGLIPALRGLAKEYTETFGLRIEVQTEPAANRHLPPDVESAVFRVAQEALTNVCKHAEAGRVRVQLSLRGDVVELLVEDNGKGFDGNRLAHPSGEGGLGLCSMRERALLLGGELNIETAPGSGTRIVLLVPLEGARAGIDVDRQCVTTARAHTGVDTTVLLVDDHAMFREGLRAVLDARPGIAVIGDAEDGRQAIHMVETLHPDVVVMDIAMPNLNGFEATRQIGRRFPDVQVVILTAHESREYLVQIVKIGAAACVLKRSVGTDLVRAIEAVAQGQKYVSPTVAGMLLEDYQTRIDQDGEDLLTEREHEVLQLVAEGRTNQEIAQQLIVSVKTVEGHRTKIMRKLGAHDRTDLVKYAIRMGMITPD